MPKRSPQTIINTRPAVHNGELVHASTVVQVSQLALSGPWRGDLQIIGQGRLIVGEHPDLGERVVATTYGLFGYDPNGVNTFAVHSRQYGNRGAGDVFAGYVSGNYLLFDQSEGTLGVYSPAGAGFIAAADGSLYAGDTDAAHMRWNTATRAIEVRNGEDVKISLDANGDAMFDGTVYASGGRIYGQMQVDGLFRAGDVDGPGISLGRFERTNDLSELVESSEIIATDANNLPWFHVVAGGGTAAGGWFQVGSPGDYAGRMTYDGDELRVANWIVNSDRLTSPTGYIELDTLRGVEFYNPIDSTDERPENRMVSFWNAAGDPWASHRIDATVDTTQTPDEHSLLVQAQPVPGYRARIMLSALGNQQANARLRAVGGYDTANQQEARIDLWAYRAEGSAFNYTRADLAVNAVAISPYTSATAFTGTLPDGLLMYTDGTWNPGGLGEGLYLYSNAAWHLIRGPYDASHRWGDATNYAQIDGDGILTFPGGVARLQPRYGNETKTADFTASTQTYYRVNTTSGAVTVTLPTAVGISGRMYIFKLINGSNSLTLDPDGAETIDGASTWATTTLYAKVTIISNGTNWEIIA